VGFDTLIAATGSIPSAVFTNLEVAAAQVGYDLCCFHNPSTPEGVVS
jgi:hypothetical protein